MSKTNIDAIEKAILLALFDHARGHDWDEFRVDLSALRDRRLELGREGMALWEGTAALLRRMTGAYLKRPDPAGWAAAADLIERTCDGATCFCSGCRACKIEPDPRCLIRCPGKARIWRSRSRHYAMIMAGFRQCLAATSPRRHSRRDAITYRAPGAVVSFTRRGPATVSVRVERPTDLSAGGGTVWFITAADPRYHTRRCLDLIDDHRDLLNAEG